MKKIKLVLVGICCIVLGNYLSILNFMGNIGYLASVGFVLPIIGFIVVVISFFIKDC